MKLMLAKHAFLKALTVEPGTYSGQPEAIHSVGTWAFLLARPGLDEEIGYRLAAALHMIERTASTSKALAQTTASNTIVNLPGPEMLQDGVRRYYKEARLLP
jgi:TRAP-type uncharacterized transport system substrate-binding protein